MLGIVIFAIFAALGIIFSILVFTFKDILRATLMLSGVFFANSLLFLLIGQPILAVVQLFIMVGGVTTFIFAGVASIPYSKFKHTRLRLLIVFWIVFFLAIVLPLFLGNSLGVSGSEGNIFNGSSINESISSGIGLFYIMLILLFGVSLGSIVLMKRMGAKK
ncbi:MAG: hypothetical protein M1504_02215 [Candidatus Marsarchaeota archaeon]|nr:hypothetical protein [Candidatus Marsarchaeota archaeon]